MKTAEEMTRDVLVRRDEALIQKRKTRRTLAVSAAALAAVCLLAVLAIPRLGPQGQKPAIVAEGESTAAQEHTGAVSSPENSGDPPRTTEPSQSTAEPEPAPNIIWTAKGNDADSASELDSQDPQIADRVTASQTFIQTLREAKDDDVLAFVLSVNIAREGAPGEDIESTRLYQLYSAADDASWELRKKLVSEMMAEKGISDTEAIARVTRITEYQEARKKAYQAWLAYALYDNRAKFQGAQSVIDVMREKGFTVLCTNAETGYTNYYTWDFGTAVLSGTAAQIRALTPEGFPEQIKGIKLYATGPIQWEEDAFAGHERPMHLQDDSRLTDELRAAYAANDGAPLRVIVKMGWTGEWIDPHEYAYAAMNVTEQEFQNINDWTMEQVQHYYEVLIHYTYPVREDTVMPLLEEGELVEIHSWAWEFVAELSEARALAICEPREGNVQVAYILSYEEQFPPRQGDGEPYMEPETAAE